MSNLDADLITETPFRKGSFLALLALLGGCQSVCVNDCAPPLLNYDYDYFYTDAPDQKQIKLTLVSKSKRQICAGRETWPSSGLLLTNAGNNNGVYLLVQGHIYAYKDSEYWAYCPQKSCYNPVSNQQKIEGYLGYADFGLPEDSHGLPKELKFKPQPSWCDQGGFLPE